jgi:hypothetical protein
MVPGESRLEAAGMDASAAEPVTLIPMTAWCRPRREHTCLRVRQRAARRGLPVIVVHRHLDYGDLLIAIPRPLELTQAAKKAVLTTFVTWGGLADFSRTRARIHYASVEIEKIPADIPGGFVEAVAAHLFFKTAVLP